VANRVGLNVPARQPMLKGTGWVEDFNPSARFCPSCLARPSLLAHFKKNIIKSIKRLIFHIIFLNV